MFNKLHSIKPSLGEWQPNYRIDRKEEVILARLRIGHTFITHSFLLKVEVSLHYPKRLHDMHNDFPLAPEKKFISNDQLSPHAKQMWLDLHPNASGKIIGLARQEKLITDLHDKDHYVVHYRNLKLYVKLEIEIKKIHKVLEFEQDTWLKCI